MTQGSGNVDHSFGWLHIEDLAIESASQTSRPGSQHFTQRNWVPETWFSIHLILQIEFESVYFLLFSYLHSIDVV